MRKYNPKEIEKKWQKYWEDNNTFKVNEDSDKEKFYPLVEFPYPSGEGLHVGHPRPFTAMDVIARKKRMEQKNVLYPMGFDAFGLPTENYAIKTGRPPAEVTAENIANFTRQLKMLGYSFDWSRAVDTTDPKYYKWTQWIFLQMFKHGLAYKKNMPINWCLSCKIGLANEEVVDGKCERCSGEVEKRDKEQWMLSITKYADKLLQGLEGVNYINRAKVQQQNWIGRSEGAQVIFSIKNSKQKLEVFTTRPDTLFGATYMVISPEHSLIEEIKKKIENFDEVKQYVKAAKLKSDLERTELQKEKTGVELKGIKVINPASNEEIPVFVADYVLSSYGTGAIMAVPAHDERDFEFAKKYDLNIRHVVAPLLINSFEKDNYREDKETVKRKNVFVILKHWKDDSYYCLDWEKYLWKSFIIGGVEEGEDWQDGAVREMQEESGYQNIKNIKKIGQKTYNSFYAAHKGVNRFADSECFLIELADGEKVVDNEIDTDNHQGQWIKREDVSQFVNLKNHLWYWNQYINGESAVCEEGYSVNSDFLNGLTTQEAKEKMIDWLEKKGIGKKEVNYKLRDWVFSRQRYWGEPIPLVHCDSCTKNVKKDVLILHGWDASSQSDFIPFLKDDLEEKGYNVYVFDAPNSDEPVFEEWYEFIKNKIKENNLKDFTIVGHSMGGHLAMKLAEKYKLDRLVLIAPVGFSPSEKYFKQFESKLDINEMEVFKKYQDRELDVEKVKENAENITFLFGQEDNWITEEIRKWYISNFNDVADVTTLNEVGHFMEVDKVNGREFVLNLFKDISMAGWQALNLDQLPLELPKVDKYEPTDTGESPLSQVDNWVKTICPKCGGEARRETDTMPNWAGSSWYFLRYCDPNNDKEFANINKLKYWGPIDWYNGGMEHTVLHLLYSRFWNLFLYDIGVVPFKEPYKKRTSHGMILAQDGEKMSKSRGNVVNPDDMVERFGTDSFRTYIMFMGPFDQAVSWDNNGLVGVRRFVERVWSLQDKMVEENDKESLFHQTIKKVTDDIDKMHFNTAIAKMMEFVNELYKEGVTKEQYTVLIKLLSPFCPHMCEELWFELGNKESITYENWPQYDEGKIKEEMIKLAVQVNGKVRDILEVSHDISEDDAKQTALDSVKVKKWLDGAELKKIIYVKGKLISIVV